MRRIVSIEPFEVLIVRCNDLTCTAYILNAPIEIRYICSGIVRSVFKVRVCIERL